MFADRYLTALHSSLQEDEHHHATGVLRASAFADASARNIGSLLHRVKYSGTVIKELARAAIERVRLESELAAAMLKTGTDEKTWAVVKGIQAERKRMLTEHDAVYSLADGDGTAFRQLFAAWTIIVAEKGAERQWIKPQDVPAIGHLAPAMYRRIAEHSMAHYLDGLCNACGGTGAKSAKEMFRTCTVCEGTRRAKLTGISHYEAKLVADMISELESLESKHAMHAASLLRRD
jgi:hypothetical protein